MAAAIVDVQRLRKDYGDFTAVDDVSFRIEEGEVFGLLGPNGAGKTTTLHMLATLLRPTSGTATVNGHDIVREPGQVRKSIGMVFQEPSSDDLLTGYENLKMHALLYGIPASERGTRIREVLALVDLTDRKDEQVRHYSGGMRRRLEIARGLMHNPRVLFLDEPTLGLDPQTRTHIWEYLERLVREQRISVIVTTHYMEEADRLCDRIAIVDRGKIVVLDSPESLKRALGGDIIRLEMQNPDAAALEALPHVKKVEIQGKTASLTVEDARSHIQEILARVGKVDSVELHPPSLEDVFLRYTGRAYREEGAEGGFWERVMTASGRR
ncbi:MAG TPA: ATP-binding cassette domain-containing protein [Thermoplasmata archaeon]|nr:ATP-binding cassette domain-containing protein [Thermoplasmata archaeon]